MGIIVASSTYIGATKTNISNVLNDTDGAWLVSSYEKQSLSKENADLYQESGLQDETTKTLEL